MFIIGVSHVDDESVARVRQTIVTHKPDCLVVESLGGRSVASRSHLAEHTPSVTPVYPPPTSISQFPGVIPLLYVTCASSISRALAGTTPDGHSAYGLEMEVALDTARANGNCATVLIADRAPAITLARCRGHWSLLDLYAALPTFISGAVLPPGYIPPFSHTSALLWAVTTRRGLGPIVDVLQELILTAGDTDPSFLSSRTGRIANTWNCLLLDTLRSRSGGKLSGARSMPHAFDASTTTTAAASVTAADVRAHRRRFHAALNDVSDALWQDTTRTTAAAAAVADLPLSPTYRSTAADTPLALHFSGLPAALSSERDALLCSALKYAPGKTIVGVVGSAHLRGIEAHWESIGPPSSLSHLLVAHPRSQAEVAGAVLGAAASVYAGVALRRSAPRVFRGIAVGAAVVCGGCVAAVSGVKAVHAELAAAVTGPSNALR